MLLQVAKLIASGIAVSAISGAGVGIGTVFGSLINAVARKFGVYHQYAKLKLCVKQKATRVIYYAVVPLVNNTTESNVWLYYLLGGSLITFFLWGMYSYKTKLYPNEQNNVNKNDSDTKVSAEAENGTLLLYMPTVFAKPQVYWQPTIDELNSSKGEQKESIIQLAYKLVKQSNNHKVEVNDRTHEFILKRVYGDNLFNLSFYRAKDLKEPWLELTSLELENIKLSKLPAPLTEEPVYDSESSLGSDYDTDEDLNTLPLLKANDTSVNVAAEVLFAIIEGINDPTNNE